MNARRVILAQHGRKAPAPPPKPNRHERRAPLDSVVVMRLLAEIKAAVEEVLIELRALRVPSDRRP
jgi:hypothetical protein